MKKAKKDEPEDFNDREEPENKVVDLVRQRSKTLHDEMDMSALIEG